MARDPDLDRQPAQPCHRCGEATYASVYVGDPRRPTCTDYIARLLGVAAEAEPRTLRTHPGDESPE